MEELRAMPENKYLYETHLHTFPVSKCGRASVRESTEFYKSLGYAGIFVTNHFLDGNINADKSLPYEELINFYFSDYEEAKKAGEELGLDVFCGVESSFKGTDFLIYGLDKEWYLAHPEIMTMPTKGDMLNFLAEQGALVIQAHPYRQASYIECIRLFPENVHGAEVYNSCGTELEAKMAEAYAEAYGLLRFAGSDNHSGARKKTLGGMCADSPVTSEADFVARVKNGEMTPFRAWKDEATGEYTFQLI